MMGKDCAIGWIGVGRMGAPIAGNLLKAGYRVSVFDIDESKAEAVAAGGGRVAPSAAELARSSDILFSMVPDDRALMRLVSEPDGVANALKAGAHFIDMSTVSPSTSAEIATLVKRTGAHYLRAPVSGSTVTAASAKLTIYCSGPEAAFEQCRQLFEAISAKQTYVGGAEEARVLKLLINLILSVMPALLGEALAFGERGGLDRDVMIDAIDSSVVASPLLGYKVDMLKSRDWTPNAPIDLASKDVDLALDWGRRSHIPLPFLSLARQLYAAFQASGDGGKDFFAVSTWPERLTGAVRERD